jgi:hypothetical protein
MTAPFYPDIKGTTSGTPGTGAFTPNAAASTYRAWSTVPIWVGLVRYEDGTAWELSWSYWNGTTLVRASTPVDSSTGSTLSLTAAATAAMVVDPSEVMSHLGGVAWRGVFPLPNSTSLQSVGGTFTFGGTAAAAAIAATNYLTLQPRVQFSSATTANAQAHVSVASAAIFAAVSTTAGWGGFEFVARFGASALPTGPRLFAGMTSATFVGNTGEPSALVAHVAAFAKDSTDTNIQLLVNSNAGSGTKIDTGIPLVANGWYEASVWCEPGSNQIYALLVRLDTGAIWYGTTTSDVPGNGALLTPQLIGGLSSTTGTAFALHFGSIFVRSGG